MSGKLSDFNFWSCCPDPTSQIMGTVLSCLLALGRSPPPPPRPAKFQLDIDTTNCIVHVEEEGSAKRRRLPFDAGVRTVAHGVGTCAPPRWHSGPYVFGCCECQSHGKHFLYKQISNRMYDVISLESLFALVGWTADLDDTRVHYETIAGAYEIWSTAELRLALRNNVRQFTVVTTNFAQDITLPPPLYNPASAPLLCNNISE